MKKKLYIGETSLKRTQFASPLAHRYIEVLRYLLLEGLSGVVALTRVTFFILCPFCNTVSSYCHVRLLLLLLILKRSVSQESFNSSCCFQTCFYSKRTDSCFTPECRFPEKRRVLLSDRILKILRKRGKIVNR